MAWQTPIYDRTQTDVDRVIYLNSVMIDQTATEDEIAEWTADLKGALNASDWQRILGNIQVLADEFETSVTLPSADTTFPKYTEWKKLLAALDVIADVFPKFTRIPAVPTQPINTYQQINDIEQFLDIIYTIYNSIDYFRCNDDYYAGGEIGLL